MVLRKDDGRSRDTSRKGAAPCFVNTTEYPIQIHASVSGGQVHISIYGTDDYGHSVRLSSSVVSSDSEYITYEAYQDIYDSYGDLIESVNLGTSTYERH